MVAAGSGGAHHKWKLIGGYNTSGRNRIFVEFGSGERSTRPIILTGTTITAWGAGQNSPNMRWARSLSSKRATPPPLTISGVPAMTGFASPASPCSGTIWAGSKSKTETETLPSNRPIRSARSAGWRSPSRQSARALDAGDDGASDSQYADLYEGIGDQLGHGCGARRFNGF